MTPEQKFSEAFYKEAKDASPETDVKQVVPGTQEEAEQDKDPGETLDDWDGTDVEQHSPDVVSSADSTRDRSLESVFANPPSKKGTFKKVSHDMRTAMERVISLCGRR